MSASCPEMFHSANHTYYTTQIVTPVYWLVSLRIVSMGSSSPKSRQSSKSSRISSSNNDIVSRVTFSVNGAWTILPIIIRRDDPCASPASSQKLHWINDGMFELWDCMHFFTMQSQFEQMGKDEEEFCNQSDQSQKKAGCCDFLQDIGRTLDDQITHSQGLDCREKSLGSRVLWNLNLFHFQNQPKTNGLSWWY